MKSKQSIALFLCLLTLLLTAGCVPALPSIPAPQATAAPATAAAPTTEAPADETGTEAPVETAPAFPEVPTETTAPAPTETEAEDLSPIAHLKRAHIGDKVSTGIRCEVPDNWYKFYQDDEAVYLIYGDYYEVRWLNAVAMNKANLVARNDYAVGAVRDNHSHRQELLDFMLDENNWLTLRYAFHDRYPRYEITVTGSPTKEQMEAMLASPDIYGMGVIRPHTGVDYYGGCSGYWLASVVEGDSSSLYGVTCLEYLGPIYTNRADNSYAFRPLVKISLEQTPLSEAELEEDALQDAALRSPDAAGKLFGWACGDFNADGRKEAFALFSPDKPIDSVYRHVRILFVRGDGQTSLLAEELSGYWLGWMQEVGDRSYLSWFQEEPVRGTSLIYGVGPDGEAYSPAISNACRYFSVEQYAELPSAIAPWPEMNNAMTECLMIPDADGLEFTPSFDHVQTGGETGDLTWEFQADGTLVFRGEGRMDDYWYRNGATHPWWAFRYAIRTVRLPAGLTHIGGFCFYGMNDVEEIWFEGSRAQWENLLSETADNPELLDVPLVHTADD